MKRTFVAMLSLVLCLGLCGCATNLYRKYYKDGTKGVDPFKAGLAVIPTADPEIINGGADQKADVMKMKENNYEFLGISSFWAGNTPDEQAIELGKEIHAEKILLYRDYKDTQSGVIPITLPNTQTTTTMGMIGSTNVSAQSTTYGSKTDYLPYSVDRYNYLASFWVKRTAPLVLGLMWKDLTDELRKQIGSNKGVVVTGVIKNTPAFNADFFVNDIIKKIDDFEVVDTKGLSDLLNTVNGKKVTITFLRDGKELTKEVQTNAKP
ncbi:MAG: PDZ domain-containing protein [Candidatus Omnitrophota bacterium]